MRKWETPLPWLALTIALNGASGGEVIRTQTRPAIEYVSGKEYLMVPGSSCGAEVRKEQCCRGTAPSVSVCSQSAPCNFVFSLKDVFKNLRKAVALVPVSLIACFVWV